MDLFTEKLTDYELLDSGDGQKLERFGAVVMSRPEPQAIWRKSLGDDVWNKAQAVFARGLQTGKWNIMNGVAPEWTVDLGGLVFNLKFLPSKHLGVFPEQFSNWTWLEDKIKREVGKGSTVKVLNLFAYTGGATMAAARAGAEVCHVDSSKFAVDVTNANLKSSGLKDKPVRLIVDDVRKFVEKEIRRGSKYDIILLDPPVYGKGVKDEVWKIEEDLTLLISKLDKILSTKPLAVVLNGYASIYSPKTYERVLQSVCADLGGRVESGELLVRDFSGHSLSSGIFARWSKSPFKI
jgi:23S rRNA (cytosine1962-C5)-methyltransferase